MPRFFEFKLPKPGVNEFRIHGVGGTPPEDLLEHPHPQPVSGDSLAGFFRNPDSPHGRNIEAYSWGGLTSRNALRSLWLLLLPFTLVNVAGWMVESDSDPKNRTKRQLHPEFQERAIRLVAFLVTISFVTWVAAIFVDLVAHQCGGQPVCREGHWWLDFLGRATFENHPASRIAVGLLPPLLALFALKLLSYRSRKTFEKFNPNGLGKEAGDAANLRDRAFWYRPSLVSELSWLHIAGGLSVLVAQFAYSLALFELGEASTRLRYVAWAAVGAVVILAIGVLFVRIQREHLEEPRRARRVFLKGGALIAVVTLGILGYYAIWRIRIVGNIPTELVAFRRTPFLLLALEGFLIFLIGLSQLSWWWARRNEAREKRGAEARSWAIVLAIVFLALVLTASVQTTRFLFGWIFGLLALGAFVANWRRKPSRLLSAMAIVGLLSIGFSTMVDNWMPAIAAMTALGIAWTLMAVDASWQRDRFRWSGTATVSLLGVFILTGSFAGTAMRVADFLDRDPTAEALTDAAEIATINLDLPAAYDWFAVVFAASVSLTVFAAVMLFLRTRIDRIGWQMPTLATKPVVAPAKAIEGRRKAEAESQIVNSVALARTAKAGDLILTFLAGMTAVALLTGIAQAVWDGSDSSFIDRLLTAYSLHETEWLLTPSSWLLAALPLLLVIGFRRGYSSEAARRKLGIVWDVASFWPRRFHPLASPSYAERVVPELQQRIEDAVGEANDRGGKVVLAAHSQGSIVGFAALATCPVEQMESIAMATYGSPLGSLYRRAFPTYFKTEDFDAVARALSPDGDPARSRWKNFYRDTDPIGGKVFTEPWPPPEPVDPRDIYLADPYQWSYYEGQPTPRPLGHSDYIYDDELATWLATIFPPGDEPATDFDS